MQVLILKPAGYCYGVIHAINQAKEIKQNNPDKRVVVFGLLVHNKTVQDELAALGIETLDISNKDPYPELDKFNQDDAIIFTAHGHPKKYEEILDKKGIKYYDLTCFKVQQTFELIKEAKEIIYIGKKGHPETTTALTMNPSIHLYDIQDGIDYAKIKTKDPIIINQTTLSFLELRDIHQEIQKKLPDAIITNEICDAAYLRQKALKELDDSYDAIIVIGSKLSSNSNKLYQLALHYHPTKKNYFIENKQDLGNQKLDFQKVVLVSGTSVPPAVINEIATYLKEGK